MSLLTKCSRAQQTHFFFSSRVQTLFFFSSGVQDINTALTILVHFDVHVKLRLWVSMKMMSIRFNRRRFNYPSVQSLVDSSLSCPVLLSCLVLSSAVLLSCPLLCCPVLSCPPLCCPVLSGPGLCHTWSSCPLSGLCESSCFVVDTK